MKKSMLLLCAAVSVLFFASCIEEADISVTNMLDNVALENISFGGKTVKYSGQLLPGQTASRNLKDTYDKVSFPMTERITFVMKSGDNSIYLKTKEFFTLKEGDRLHIEITSDMEVLNAVSGTPANLAEAE